MLIRRQTEMADEGCHMISVSPVPLADVFGCSEKDLCELCALAPLQEPGPRRRGFRKGAKAQSSQKLSRKAQLCLSRRLEIIVNLNTQMQDTVTSGKRVGANFDDGRKQRQDSADRI